VPALVIDLRGNEGGLDVGDVLLAHLLDAPHTFQGLQRRVRYRSVPPELAPYLDTWDPSFKDWGDAARPYDARFYTLVRSGDVDSGTIVPATPRYTGRVFVLIGPGNSSATFEFALRARRSGVATLVGQPTGGNRRGINGGAFFFLRLPNTRLELDLPLIGQFPLQPEPDAGIAPDIHVETALADLVAGRVAELAAVRRAMGQAPGR
jgi:C-terminal processing protease CtpA/Prc